MGDGRAGGGAAMSVGSGGAQVRANEEEGRGKKEGNDVGGVTVGVVVKFGDSRGR